MRRLVLIISVCAFVSCGQEGKDYVDGVIVFDNSKNYPELDLRLSDVADVTYIPLRGEDEGYLVSQFDWNGNLAFIDGDEIYFLSDNNGVVYVYDMSGNPLRKLDRRGRGSQEYGSYIRDFWVSRESNSLYVHGDLGTILEYDATSFDFKRRVPLPLDVLPHSIVPFGDDYALLHNYYQFENNDAEATFYLLSKPDWEPTPLSVEMQRPYVHDFNGALTYPGLIYGKGGVFLHNMRSDTISWIDNNTRKTTPRMVDKTNYPGRDQPGHDIMAVPSFETDKYLFFSLIFQQAIHTNMEMRAFVFDKELEKIFRLPQTEDRMFAIARDECWLNCWNTTLNDNYAVTLFQAINLLDNLDTLPAELKQIAATLTEDDNPVMALVKFK
jgi:hypothetical protein